MTRRAPWPGWMPRARPPLLLDGGMGTWLQHRGLPVGMPPEAWLLDRFDAVVEGHRAFADAGAELLLTCTLNAHPDTLRPLGLHSFCGELRRLAVDAARRGGEARAGGVRVGGVVGPVRPGLPLPLVEAWSESAGVDLSRAGVDLLVAEVITDADEGESRVRGLRHLGLPVVACVVPGTPAAEHPALTGRRLVNAGATWLGAHCGDVSVCLELLEGMGATDEDVRARAAWLKPHAGMPGALVPPGPWADAFARAPRPRVLAEGGCCQASPDHLRALAVARSR